VIPAISLRSHVILLSAQQHCTCEFACEPIVKTTNDAATSLPLSLIIHRSAAAGMRLTSHRLKFNRLLGISRDNGVYLSLSGV